MSNKTFIGTIGGGLNMSGFITPGYKSAINDELKKGEVTDSLRYDNNFKYTKSGKEIKAALERAKSAYQLKKDDLANQMSLLKEKLDIKPFAPISTWQMRGFDKQLGLQFNYPYEFFRYVDSGNGDFQKYPPSVTLEDCCSGINKRFNCKLTTEHFPSTPEDAEPYYAYNRLLDDYISQAVDILQLNIMIKNLNDKKTFELSQSQMMALDQYMDDKENDLEKGEKDDLEKGGVGIIGTTQSGKNVVGGQKADHSGYKDFSSEDHKDATKLYRTHIKSIKGNTNENKEAFKSHQNALGEKTNLQKGGVGSGKKGNMNDLDEEKQKLREVAQTQKELHTKKQEASNAAIRKLQGYKDDNLKKAYETLGFDEDFNDIEKADNEGGDSKAVMHTNGGDPVDVSDLVITNGNDHWVDVIDPATGKPRFKSGDKIKYKLEDDATNYKGTVTEEKHPTYEDNMLKVKHNKKKEVEVA